MQQIFSLLLHRKPDHVTAEYFRGSELSVTVPATIHLHLDGSTVKIKDYLSKSNYGKLDQAGDASQVMVTYRIEAMPHALEVAIPRGYNQELFEHRHKEQAHETELSHATPQQQTEAQEARGPQEEQHSHKASEQEEREKDLTDLANSLLEHGRKVTVIGKVPNPAKKHTYIIAGHTPKVSSGELKPVAVVVNGKTTILDRNGQHLPHTALREVQEGAVIVVEGKQSKRGVIEAARLIV